MAGLNNEVFFKEFVYRTKLNYYNLLKTDSDLSVVDKVSIEEKIRTIESEMRRRNYTIDNTYEVTQLVNSLVGLLVFPEQKKYKYMDKKESDLPLKLPILNKCVTEDKSFVLDYYIKKTGGLEEKSPSNILRHMRNAVGHERIMIHPQNARLENGQNQITAIVFQDEEEYEKDGRHIKNQFRLKVSVNDLEALLMEISDYLIQL